MFLRRPGVASLALLTGARGTPRRGVAFLSWFGPVGVSSIFYSLFVEQYSLPGYDRIFAAASLAIACSIVVFSITATPGARRYAGRSRLTTLSHPLTPGVDGAP